MIYITQLIFINEGMEKVFDEFENKVKPVLARHNGRILYRVRPASHNYVECLAEKPYEIQIVEMNTQQDLDNFLQDKEREKYLHLKKESVKTSLLFQGKKMF